MRGTILLGALLLGFAAPAAAADPPAPGPFWEVSEGRLSFRPAQLSVPRRAGGVEYFETTEFSHKGEGVDNAIKYRSADQKVFATLYVYYPSIAHTGVQAIATDQAIRGSARSPNIRSLGTGIASAAGMRGVAVTADYDHYLGEHHTKSAFIKAGRWMLKLRVTGPESRSAEVNAVMTALLDGLRFEGKVQPRPAVPIVARDCAPADRPEAAPVAGGGEAATIAVSDAAGEPAVKAAGGDQKALPARIGRDWCRTKLQVQGQQMAVLQAAGKKRPGRGLDADSALLVLFNDGGGVLEVVRLAKGGKYLLLHHEIAEVKVLESYDRLPSLAQIGGLFTNPTGIRARIRLRPDGSPEIQLPGSHSDKGGTD
jgi:hypothetical protein